ncbi:DUF3869 domain-containing protein [Fulvivirga sp. 29W222]|uniref:DUF3869 domain-containing protein n=1 Tax=Fulvivirga marina TaxID=2494733 RepID=A0A937KBI6_9BACT|nr:DUF3869 domain-containing protein [Fulvivirga marina]MBL6446059.1 DUF3869 domain-containing protein [Fulvivirga marina]
MKTTRILSFLLVVLLAGVFTSCKDDFTEEDALNAQQTVDVSVYVIDYFNTTAVTGATVSIIKDGAAVTAQTNEQGIASFSDVKIGGGLPVTVEKEGFTKVQNLVDVNVNDYRQGHFTTTLGVLSLTENTATIKGKLEIESDVTNDETEVVPEGTEVKAFLNLEGMNTVEFVATTDANGFYELVVPATNTGVDYQLKYQTLVLDQKIAKNGNKGDADFPATIPSIGNIATTFNPVGSAIEMPSVPSLVATLPAPTDAGGTQAVIVVDFGSMTGDAGIGDFDVEVNGTGYTASAVLDVTVTSLFGGSGLVATWTVDGSGNVSGNANISDAGSGYPTSYEANKAGEINPSFDNYVDIQSGEVRLINGHYGTGTIRAEEIQ